MPKPQLLENRERIDLHAPWYSAQLVPSPVPVRTLILNEDQETWEDREPYDEKTQTHQRYVEHVTIFAHGLHEDEIKVNERIMERMRLQRRGSSTPSGKDIAISRTLMYQRRVLEITDETGKVYEVSEPFLRRLEDQETAFIDNAIAHLKSPAVPVLDEDREKGAADFAKQEKQIAAGFPIANPLTEEAMVAHNAEAGFPPHADRDFAWERETE